MPTDEEFLAYNQGIIKEFRENGGVVAQGAERDRLYGLIAAQVPAFGEYEKNTERTFPVVVLEGVPVPA